MIPKRWIKIQEVQLGHCHHIEKAQKELQVWMNFSTKEGETKLDSGPVKPFVSSVNENQMSLKNEVLLNLECGI